MKEATVSGQKASERLKARDGGRAQEAWMRDGRYRSVPDVEESLLQAAFEPTRRSTRERSDGAAEG